MNRNASATWRGSPNDGGGTLTTASEVLSQATYSTSIDDGTATNPEELIAAAVAGCFAKALAKELSLAGVQAELIESTVIATVDDQIGAEGSINHLQLNLRAKVPGSSQDQFVQAALAAKANSPIARLLKTTISMTASLERD